MAERVKLTKRRLDALNSDGKAQRRVYDASVPGFGVTISKTGRRSFFLEYVPPGGGRRRRMVLGHYGEFFKLDQARSEAYRVKSEVAAGRDPLDARKSEREAGTFQEWAERFKEIGLAEGRWAPKTYVQIERHLRRACEAFGHRRLTTLDAPTIEQWRDRLRVGIGPTEVNHCLVSVKTCLREAWGRGLIQANEASKVKNLPKPPARTRTVSEDEMDALIKAVNAHEEPTFRVAMLWLADTGARRSEVLRATWGDLLLKPIAEATWTIPKPKNGVPSRRPIPPSLVGELKALPRESTLVVGHKWTESKFHKAWVKLRATAELPDDIHLHDLRRTKGLKVYRNSGLKAAQMLLGHADIKTTAKVYTPLDAEDVREAQNETVAQILPFSSMAKSKTVQ